jgi:hypothetical protein
MHASEQAVRFWRSDTIPIGFPCACRLTWLVESYPVAGCWINVRLRRAVLEEKVIHRREGQALRVGAHAPPPVLPAIR